MNKQDFRLDNARFLELRNELRKPQTHHQKFIIPTSVLALLIACFVLVSQSNKIAYELPSSADTDRELYNELAEFEKEFELKFKEKKQEPQARKKNQRWIKNKSINLAEKMADTRLRLKKLKNKINS